MGEEKNKPLRTEFNGAIRVEGRPERLTGDAGAIILREVDQRLGVTQHLASVLHDPRSQDHITHPFQELLQTIIFLFAMGWRDQDDADSLRDDPAMRLAVSTRRGDEPLRKPEQDHVPDGLASQPTHSRLVRSLSTEHNRAGLRSGMFESAVRRLRAMRRGHRPRYITIDVDSLPIEVHGQQKGSEYNGYYHRQCYHPLVATCAETGDLLDMKLRPGKVHTANGALEFIVPLLDKAAGRYCQVVSLRCDAGFPEPELLEALDERHIGSVFRIKNNSVLDIMAEPYLQRPPGRPPAEPRTWLYELVYRAESWSRPWRVVLVVQERPGELFLHHFWLLTNWSTEKMDAPNLLALYRDRGTAEGYFGELMSVLDPALSCTTRQKSHYRGKDPKKRTSPGDPFAANEVTLLLAGLAFNLLNASRILMERTTHQGWSLQRLRERVLKVPARVVLHSRYVMVVLGAEVASLWRKLWRHLSGLSWIEAHSPT
ncbi:MAG: IS1380 family transposase [bacterium]|nr:IS1380 family transposase [bacterium]